MRALMRLTRCTMEKLSFARASPFIARMPLANVSFAIPSGGASNKSQISPASATFTSMFVRLFFNLLLFFTALAKSSCESKPDSPVASSLNNAWRTLKSAFCSSLFSCAISSSSSAIFPSAWLTMTAVMRFWSTSVVTMMTAVKKTQMGAEYSMRGRTKPVQLSSVIAWKSENAAAGTVLKNSCTKLSTSAFNLNNGDLPIKYTANTEKT
mmetsp:Transcript_44880/g.124796  ORF Transcript_44880/g.124796 Transcript_44880/m.124796 type:complete len:210 (-) Transcript_44880:230-859(-)